jgi:hypothetical protein
MLFAVGVSSYSAVGNVAKLVFLSIGLAVAFSKFGFREAVWVLALSQLLNYLPQLWGLRMRFRPAARTETACFVAFLGIILIAVVLSHMAA